MEKKDNKEKSKARKKALGLAATAAAAAIAPQAAEIAVQKTEIPAPVQEAPEISVPEPVREEYAKPRPLKTIGDLIKGVFGIGTARAQTPPSYFPYADRVDPSRPRLPVIPPPPPPSRDLPGGITVSPRLQPPASYPPDSSYRPAPMPDPGQPRTPPPTQPIAPPGSAIDGSRPVTPVPTPPAPTPQHPEAVVNATRAALRNMLDLTAEQASNIRVVRVESVQWGDPSLGLPEQGRTYPQVVTPGYRVTLRYQDQFFVYHTNESGSSVKFASQTNYDPGPRLVPPGGIIASPPLQPPASYPPDSSYRPAPMPDPGQPRTPPPTQPIAPPGSAIDGSRPVTPVPTPPLPPEPIPPQASQAVEAARTALARLLNLTQEQQRNIVVRTIVSTLADPPTFQITLAYGQEVFIYSVNHDGTNVRLMGRESASQTNQNPGPISAPPGGSRSVAGAEQVRPPIPIPPPAETADRLPER